MNDLIKMMEANHAQFILLALLWVSLWILASVVYRVSRGKTVIPFRPKDTLFCEGWASGHSNRSLLTKLGGARNCLLVAVTPDALVIQPRFPLNLMFLPEIYDLEHRIIGPNIRRIGRRKSIFGEGIDIQFIDAGGEERSVTLYLRSPEDFLKAVRRLTD